MKLAAPVRHGLTLARLARPFRAGATSRSESSASARTPSGLVLLPASPEPANAHPPVLYWPQTVISATRTGANPKESHPMRKDTLLITVIAFGLTLAGIASAEDQPIWNKS